MTRQKNAKDPSFKTEEDKIYIKLNEVYPNTIRQYGSDKRYPHSCDFYIPELDMFIEYNGYPTHGGHAFNPNDNDDIMLAEKLKNNEFIHGDWETFTIRDPKKRKDAKDNNLNFVELWTFKQALQFVEKLRSEKN